jgi:hypothetical protein
MCPKLLTILPFGILRSLLSLTRCRNLTLGKCEDETHTPKSGNLESSGTSKTQNSIVGVKTPRIGVFFIPLERSLSVDVQNGLAFEHLQENLWQFDSRPLKVRNRLDPGAFR